MWDNVRAVATKPRHLKTPTQLWIADNRKRLGLTPGDLARLTGVTEDTARGWESRGKPSQDAMTLLVQRFGVPAPDDMAGSGVGDATSPELAALLKTQTEAIERHGILLTTILAKLVEDAVDREGRLRAVEAELESLREQPTVAAPEGQPVPRRTKE